MVAFYRLDVRQIWLQFLREPLYFWMLCGYIVVEYVRPQSIIPALDVLPWAKVFLSFALIGLLSDRRVRWVADSANTLMTTFLFVILLASAFAIYPQVSWSKWFDFVGWFVIYFLIIHIVSTEKRFFIVLVIFLLASFKLSFFGARTWAMRGFAFTNWGIAGPSGPFQNSGELSIQMLMFAPIAYQAALALRPYLSRTKHFLLLLFPITAAMTVIGASSRGAQLGLGYQLYRCLLKGRLSLRTLLVAAIVAGTAFAFLPEEQKDRFTSAGKDDTSVQRLLYWQRGLDMLEDHPLLGVGFYNFAPYFQDNYPQDVLRGAAQLPHNIFIQVGTDAGLLGLGVFLALLYRNFRCCREIRRICLSGGRDEAFASRIALGLIIALWGFVIAGQFVSVAYYPFFWMNLAMSVALLNVVKRENPNTRDVGP